MSIEDSYCADLDQAMIVRREGMPGNDTPEGLLTVFKGNSLEKLMSQLENMEDPWAIELGLLLYKLNGNTLEDLGRGVSKISNQSLLDSSCHDITFGVPGESTGITIHCNLDSLNWAANKLQVHCDKRKYIAQSNSWFGICIEPGTLQIRLGMKLQFPWEADPGFDQVIVESTRSRISGKTGRNAPCPCGRKFKKCCMG